MEIDTYQQFIDPLKFQKGVVDNCFDESSMDDNIIDADIPYETYYLKNNLQPNSKAAEAIVQDTKNERLFSLLVFGGKNTPYENCGFTFTIALPNHYPENPPLVSFDYRSVPSQALMPNILHDGKILLSILGNYPYGFEKDKWKKNNKLYDVVFMFRLLFCTQEPFFLNPQNIEKRGTAEGIHKSKQYNQRARMISVAHGIVDLLQNTPRSFVDTVNMHFICKKMEILERLDRWEKMFDPTLGDINTKYREITYSEWMTKAKNEIEKLKDKSD